MTKTGLLLKCLKGYKHKVAGIVIVTVLFVFVNLFMPLLFSFLVDQVVNGEPIENALVAKIVASLGGIETLRTHMYYGAILVMMTSVVICSSIFLRGKWNGEVSETLSQRLRDRLFHHLTLLPYAYHVQANTGDLIQRCTSDVDTVRRVFAGQISEFIYSLSTLTMAMTILFQIYPPLALVSISLLPFVFLFSIWFFIRNQKAFLIADEVEGELVDNINQNIAAIRVVKAFNREVYEAEQFDKRNQNNRDKWMNLMRYIGFYWGFSDFICYSSVLLVVVVGVGYCVRGDITIGNLFVFMTYQTMVTFPIRNLGRLLSDLGKVRVSLGRLLEILNVPAEDIYRGETPELRGDIIFENVSFQYDDGNQEVLRDLSFTIKQGETIAIMGPTGSGKSSLVHLLTRLYDYNAGSIRINGTELRDIQKQYLRRMVGIVLQEPFLFSKTIYDNIRLSSPNAREEDIKRASKIASIDEVIVEFDAGYQTMVGERGVTLSGGQKQRIAIARTVINQTPILIFDDSLSAVDTETDANIRSALQQLNKNTTTIIITQRITSSETADHILVLDEGRILQEGSHQQLISQKGLYQRIYQLQSRLEGDKA